METLHHFFENGGITINTRCGKQFFEATPETMTGGEHLIDMKKRLETEQGYFCDNSCRLAFETSGR